MHCTRRAAATTRVVIDLALALDRRRTDIIIVDIVISIAHRHHVANVHARLRIVIVIDRQVANNIGYWKGPVEEYCKLYDYTADAAKRALPTIRMGGPETTGPSWNKAADFLETFVTHCVSGKNYATGKIGSPLDRLHCH